MANRRLWQHCRSGSARGRAGHRGFRCSNPATGSAADLCHHNLARRRLSRRKPASGGISRHRTGRGYFRGEGTTADPSFPGDIPASAIVFFSATNGIQCLNGDGSGSGSWINTTVTSINKDTWYKISIRQDYTSKKWRCYIDEAASPDQDLGFRNNEVTTLNGFRNFADTASYLDTFRVIPAIKGDANGDGKMDAADIVTLISDPTGSGFDIIQKDNADVDDNGSVEANDLTALINKILNRS